MCNEQSQTRENSIKKIRFLLRLGWEHVSLIKFILHSAHTSSWRSALRWNWESFYGKWKIYENYSRRHTIATGFASTISTNSGGNGNQYRYRFQLCNLITLNSVNSHTSFSVSIPAQPARSRWSISLKAFRGKRANLIASKFRCNIEMNGMKKKMRGFSQNSNKINISWRRMENRHAMYRSRVYFNYLTASAINIYYLLLLYTSVGRSAIRSLVRCTVKRDFFLFFHFESISFPRLTVSDRLWPVMSEEIKRLCIALQLEHVWS